METVETTLKECDDYIRLLKINGIQASVIIALLERLIDVVRTIAVHTVAARIKKV